MIVLKADATAPIETFNTTKLSLGDTADFQAYVDLAAVGTTVGAINWFQYAGNTYIVEDLNASSGGYLAGTDLVVRLTGLIDLSTASLNNGDSTVLLLG